MPTAAYVYCIVRSARKPSTTRAPAGLPGADRPRVDELSAGMWLVSAAVPLDRYGSEPLEASLRDLDWVSRIAVAHEAVVEHFTRARGAAVIPMKLFTMFSTLERAVGEMRARRHGLDEVFARIQGCEEWGVRVFRGQPADRRRRAAPPRSGAEFLAARKRARDDAREAVRAAAEAADRAFESLAVVAKEKTRRSGDTAGAVPPLLDAAFLVPARRRTRFQSVAQRAARDVAKSGGQMTLTGPWPPYNFIGGAASEEGT